MRQHSGINNEKPAPPQVGPHKLVYEKWSSGMGGDGVSGTIRTTPQNYYVATVDFNRNLTFEELEANTKGINIGRVIDLWTENKIPLA